MSYFAEDTWSFWLLLVRDVFIGRSQDIRLCVFHLQYEFGRCLACVQLRMIEKQILLTLRVFARFEIVFFARWCVILWLEVSRRPGRFWILFVFYICFWYNYLLKTSVVLHRRSN